MTKATRDYSQFEDWNYNFTNLTTNKEHAQYFNTTVNALSFLNKVCKIQSIQNDLELTATRFFLTLLINSLKALNLKYAYPKERGVFLDLSESGFPNQLEFLELEKDLQISYDKILTIPPASILAKNLLDTMINTYQEDAELLKILGERTYFDYIQDTKLFLQYSEQDNKLNFIKKTPKGILYEFSFACFDFATNRPYINHITLEKDDASLDIPRKLEQDFIASVRQEGMRAAPLAVIASSLDEKFDTLHPKIYKRLCVGPLYSCYMFNLFKENSADETEMQLRKIFSRILESNQTLNNDFVLFFSEEYLFSKRQEVRDKGFLSSKKSIREIYDIDIMNVETYNKQVSKINHNVILSHSLLQCFTEADKALIKNFNQARKFIYNNKEEVYGI